MLQCRPLVRVCVLVVRVSAAVPELLTMGSRRESGVAGVQVGVHVGVTPSWGCCAALVILCPLKLSPPTTRPHQSLSPLYN